MSERSGVRAGSTGRQAERGVTEVVGLVLLLGIVLVGSVFVLVYGAQVQDSATDGVRNAKVEDSFRELGTDIDTVATGTEEANVVDFDLADTAASAVRREATGRIVVNRTNLTATQTVAVKQVGAIVYERDDRQYVYQAGAVWTGSGNATEMVSAPQISYEYGTGGPPQPTLSLRIPELEGSARLDSGEVRIEHQRTVAPFNNVSQLDDQLVTLSVTSEYYVGWGEYFEDRYPQVTTVSYDHPEDTVTVRFGQIDVDGDFGGTVVATDELYVGNGNPSTSGPLQADDTPDATTPANQAECVSEGGTVNCTDVSYTPIDAVVNGRIEQAASNAPNVSAQLGDGSPTTLTAGTYYAEGFELGGETLTIDLSSGNVSLLVDGPVGVSGGGRIEVVGGDNASSNCCYARLYVGDPGSTGYGDLAVAGGSSAVAVDDGEAKELQLYGTSEMQFAVGQGSFTGAVYAPHGGDAAAGTNEAIDRYGLSSTFASAGCSGGDVCIGQGSTDFDGALVGFHDVDVGQAASLEYDTSLTGVDPQLGYSNPIPPPISFLSVSVHEVCVGEEPDDC